MTKTVVWLLIAVFALVSIGIVSLTVAGDTHAVHGDQLFYAKHQLMALLIGLVIGLAAACANYHWWQNKKVVAWLFNVTVISVLLVLLFGIAIYGARRWVSIGPMGFQPSELVKFVVVLGVAFWCAEFHDKVRTLWHGVFLPMLFLGCIVGLVAIEPDIATAVLIGITGWTLLLIAGVQKKVLVFIALAAVVLISFYTIHDPVLCKHIKAWCDPAAHPDVAYPVLAAREAFALGGIYGIGMGGPVRHQYHLPESRTDLIFAVVGENFGMFGAVAVVSLFILIAIMGILISVRAPDRFGKLLAAGIVLSITLQAALNICGVTGLLPVKGMPLPFLSYGGSGLIMMLMQIGVLVNVARQSSQAAKGRSCETTEVKLGYCQNR